MAKVRYDPATGEEIVEQAPVDASLFPDDPRDPEFEVEVDDGGDYSSASVGWKASLIAERFSVLASALAGARRGYMNVEGAQAERDALMEEIGPAWELMEGWGILPPL